jgi:hypothetical protein
VRTNPASLMNGHRGRLVKNRQLRQQSFEPAYVSAGFHALSSRRMCLSPYFVRLLESEGQYRRGVSRLPNP